MTNDTFTTLTDPSAGGNPVVTFADGINDAGRIVGYFFDGNGRYHGFLYNNGTYTTLNDPSASSFTFAYGINDTGQIVGKYGSGYHGLPYGNGVYTTLDDPLAIQGGTQAFGHQRPGPNRPVLLRRPTKVGESRVKVWWFTWNP